MGHTQSVEAVRTERNDGTVDKIRDVCMKIIDQGEWTDYVDLQSRVMRELEKNNIKPQTVVIENIDHPAFNNWRYLNNIRVRSVDLSRYGKNYVVIKRLKSALHYNFRLIIAW